MKKKKQGLGRGLSALLNDPSTNVGTTTAKPSIKTQKPASNIGAVIELPINQIEVNPYQPRTNFLENELQELAISIEQVGIIQPITVRKIANGSYQLISGERRLRASKLANKKSIPAFVRHANDSDSLTMALIENIQREDLDAIEIALTYERLLHELQLTQEELSKRIGKKRATISNYVRLLKLNPVIQTGIQKGYISMGHGKALININDTNQQLRLYKRIIEEGLSVRNTENLSREIQEKEDSPKKENKTVNSELPNYINSSINGISKYLGTKIEVKLSKSGKGKLSIPFSSEKDFQRIQQLLSKDDSGAS